MAKVARRLYWLRHRLLRWIDRLSNEDIELMMWSALLFLAAVFYWFVMVTA
jgi:hypothetical protein